MVTVFKLDERAVGAAQQTYQALRWCVLKSHRDTVAPVTQAGSPSCMHML